MGEPTEKQPPSVEVPHLFRNRLSISAFTPGNICSALNVVKSWLMNTYRHRLVTAGLKEKNCSPSEGLCWHVTTDSFQGSLDTCLQQLSNCDVLLYCVCITWPPHFVCQPWLFCFLCFSCHAPVFLFFKWIKIQNRDQQCTGASCVRVRVCVWNTVGACGCKVTWWCKRVDPLLRLPQPSVTLVSLVLWVSPGRHGMCAAVTWHFVSVLTKWQKVKVWN